MVFKLSLRSNRLTKMFTMHLIENIQNIVKTILCMNQNKLKIICSSSFLSPENLTLKNASVDVQGSLAINA